MLDIGIEKLMLVGGIALVVIGPERLPRVARTLGNLLGRAQRYVADVKAEVNRSIELEQLQKMRGQFDAAARDLNQAVNDNLQQATSSVSNAWSEATSDGSMGQTLADAPPYMPPAPQYVNPGKKWRVKRSAVPRWYKHRQGVRTHVQSAAARVARFRP